MQTLSTNRIIRPNEEPDNLGVYSVPAALESSHPQREKKFPRRSYMDYYTVDNPQWSGTLNKSTSVEKKL